MKGWKKFLFSLIGLLSFVSMAYAAGTVVQTREFYPDSDLHVKKIIFTCTADASGVVSEETISTTNNTAIKGMRLFQVDAFPTSGGVAPDAADVFVFDADGMDLLGSVDRSTAYNGANLIHASLKKGATPSLFQTGQNSHADYYPVVTDFISLSVKNQATSIANYTIEMTFIK